MWFTIKLYEGIRVDNEENVVFNWKYDDRNKDCLLLDGLEAKEFNDSGIRYVYAYNYTTKATNYEKKKIRSFLKNVDNFEEVDNFVDNGVLRLNAVQDIRSFDAFVYIKPKKSLCLVSRIHSYLLDYSVPLSTNFELIKKCYSEVTFNENKLVEELQKLNWDKLTIEDTVRYTNQMFEKLKRGGKLFEMKKFVPRQVRVAFTDFLKFTNEMDKQIYTTLQDANVLVFDDFLTSGSTIKEIIRYLKAINPNNKITVFVLVNQKDVD